MGVSNCVFGSLLHDFGEKKNCYSSESHEKVGDDGTHSGLGYEWDAGGIAETPTMSDSASSDVSKGNADAAQKSRLAVGPALVSFPPKPWSSGIFACCQDIGSCKISAPWHEL